MRSFPYFCFLYSICFIKKNSVFIVSLYKELAELLLAPATSENFMSSF